MEGGLGGSGGGWGWVELGWGEVRRRKGGEEETLSSKTKISHKIGSTIC